MLPPLPCAPWQLAQLAAKSFAPMVRLPPSVAPVPRAAPPVCVPAEVHAASDSASAAMAAEIRIVPNSVPRPNAGKGLSMRLYAAFIAIAAAAPIHSSASNGGAALYATACASCHGNRGQGSSVAPSLFGRSAADIHLMLDTGRMPASAANVNEIPREPLFTQRQMTQLVRYVQSLSPVPVDRSLPIVIGGVAARGRAIFAQNCAQCHGAMGDGASVGYANVAPSLANATVFQVAEAIRAGPGVMPRFSTDVLSDGDVDDVARFVNFAQTHGDLPDGPNAGGFSLAHAGPVAEGFVAWFFGLGALVLFVRAIGTAGKDA
jgi:quinol---cytochrome-c reductase cytochrome c subunit